VTLLRPRGLFQGLQPSAAIAVAAEAGMDPERLPLALESTIRQAALLAPQYDRLIHYGDKVHLASSLGRCR
jgi:hypothetical protein